MGGSRENKAAYFEKLEVLLKEYRSIFIVTVDNVSSQQMHEIRISLRGEGVVLMGKNTMVRRALKGLVTDSPEYERLLPYVKGTFSPTHCFRASPLTTDRQRRFRLHQR
jgi:large subunit ribosomal protein LP0